MKRVVLSGYYGFNNAGDEAVLFAIINSLRKTDKDIDITVLSNNPEHTSKTYNVKAVNRWKLGTIYSVLKDSDLLISGGGSLLQDVTSKNGILYYLGVIFIAKLLGKKVFIYSQGIGPVNILRNRKITSIVLNMVNGITVRDESSKQDLYEMGVKKEITVSADPVLGFEPGDISQEKGMELLDRANVNINNGKIIGISIRSWNTDPKNFTAIAESCDRLIKQGWQIVFVPMHFPDDISAAREVMKEMKESAFLLKENYSPLEALSIYKVVDIVMGMRLHSLIMAAVLEKPLVAISYDPKVNRFMSLLGSEKVLDINSLKTQEILDLVQNTWDNRRGFAENLQLRIMDLRVKALLPAKMVSFLLKKRQS